MDMQGPVFVGHTSELASYPSSRSYVQAAVDGVLRSGFRPIDMGYFAARDEMPTEYCVRAVRECIAYLGIIGFCYGALVPDQPVAISYTELEFVAATQAKIPRLVFLIDEDAPFPPRLVDAHRDAIDAFRARLQDVGVLVKVVSSPDGLEAAVLHALGELRSERKRNQQGGVVNSRHPQSRPVIECDPIRLGVHRAIQVTGQPSSGMRASDLPEFVERAHDRALRAEIASAMADGQLVVLVGGSSTGKTRSAVEAVRELMPSWQLIHPLTALDLVALIGDGQVTECTVLWLNECQTYLEGSQGAEAAVAIRGLLEEAQPLIVIGTLWPEYWLSYTRTPALGSPDPYRQARQLLEVAVKIDVPDRFNELDVRKAQTLATKDSPLAVALATQRERGITQVLAGGPDLIDRWYNAPSPYGKAVISAAIDARRLGYLSVLPAGLLQAAAIAYLNGYELANASSTWFTSALAYACEPVKGAIAPLMATSHAVGRVDGYLLADYLDQHGRAVRRGEPVPDSVWMSLTSHANLAADLNRLGSSAAARGRYRHACDLWTAACEDGDLSMARSLWSLLDRAGLHAQADKVLWQAAASGDLEAMTLLTGLLKRHHRHRELEELLRLAAAAGHYEAAHDLAVLLCRAGRGSEAEQVLRQAAAAGDQQGWQLLAILFHRAGQRDRAEEALRQAAEGNKATLPSTAVPRRRKHKSTLKRHRRTKASGEETVVRTQPVPEAAVDRRAPRADSDVARRLSKASARKKIISAQGRPRHVGSPERHTWRYLREQMEAGSARAARELAVLLVQANRIDEGERILRSLTVAGDAQAIGLLTWVLSQTGRKQEASLLAKYGLAEDGSTALTW